MRIGRSVLAAILAVVALGASASDSRLRVLVIDTGVDASRHPALAEVLCPDAEHLDAISGKRGAPMDLHGHGTHVAGIIRAIAGAQGYCIASCRYYSDASTGRQNLDHEVKCLRHALKIGAQIVNISGGGPEFDEGEYNALIELRNATVVVAAGNEKSNVDLPGHKYYPASYQLRHVVVVGGLTRSGQRLPESNWGKRTVQLEMAGDHVLSSLPAGTGKMIGTSQATAMGTGAAIRSALGLPGLGKADDYLKAVETFWSSKTRH